MLEIIIIHKITELRHDMLYIAIQMFCIYYIYQVLLKEINGIKTDILDLEILTYTNTNKHLKFNFAIRLEALIIIKLNFDYIK